MLNASLLLSLRTLWKHRGHTLITMAGLAVGLGCCLVIALFVRHEWSFDRFHAHADRLYRVTYEEVDTPAMRHLATIAPAMGPALVAEYPEIEQVARLRAPHRTLLAHGDRQFYETDFFYADSTFFELFSFPLARGNPQTALNATGSIVLTQEAARKYFGAADPMGQTLQMNDEVELTVTGVLEPLPTNTHLAFDVLISFSTFRVPAGYPVTLDSWTWISFHTYVRLDEQAEPAAVETKLPGFLETHLNAERARTARLRLQPVTDIYLGTPRSADVRGGNAAYVYGLAGIAALMLLLACFNFTNLSTVHALRRGAEVGIRKVLGAHRRQLIRHYLTESSLIALLSFGVALALAEGTLYASDALFGWTPPVPLTGYPLLLLAALGVAWAVGLLAGIYPALVLSRFRPAQVLKGERASLRAGAPLRGTLTVLQFTIAVVLIASSLVIAQQMRYVQSKPLGFEEEHVVALQMVGDELQERYPELRAALLQNPNVVSVTKGGELFDRDTGTVPIFPEGGADDAASIRSMNLYSLHYDFVETLGLTLIAGRAPSEAFPTDSSDAILLNETAATILAETVPGWETPLGNALRVSDIMEGRVIGVVEDFHFTSLHAEIEPLVLFFPRAQVDKVFVRVQPGAPGPLLAALERDWNRVAADLPFSYVFLDEHLQQLYQTDRRFARLVTVFTMLTILMACLGLYGMVAFVTQLRTKEIGIRKVLGASVASVFGLLSRRFLAYVVLANLLAWPLAYVGMQRWLADFAYRTDLGVDAFAVAGGLSVGIALLTVSYHTLRTALTDPVNSLRYE